MTDKNLWYVMKCYSFFNRNQQDIFDYMFNLEVGSFTGTYEDLAKAIDCEYIIKEVVEKELQGNLFSSFFCIYWEEEDDDGNRINNSDMAQLILLDTVVTDMCKIGKEIIGE